MFTLLFGNKGTGKTLLLSYFLILEMLKSLDVLPACHKEIDFFNTLGFNFSKPEEHTVFCNYPLNCKGTGFPDRRAYSFNPFKLGLFDPGHDTELLPPGTVWGITESQRYYDSHMGKLFRPSISAAFETARHYGIDVYFDCQRPKLINLNIRDLIDRFIQCLNVEEIKNSLGVCVGHKWYCREFPDNQSVEKYLDSGDLSSATELVITSPFCLYENYDSYFCKLLHLKGRAKTINFKLQLCPEGSVKTEAEYDSYNNSYGLDPPPDYWLKGKIA